MLALDLKTNTQDAHMALEKVFVDYLKSLRGTEDYVRFLGLLYGFYQQLENSIADLSSSDMLPPDLQERRKAKRLLDDIASFDFQHNPQLCNQVPILSNATKALGAMYVMEGSTLGGQIIAKLISGKLQLPDDRGVSFFVAYGDNTQTMWQKFQTHLERPFTTAERAEIVDTARETFSTFKTWIETHANTQL